MSRSRTGSRNGASRAGGRNGAGRAASRSRAGQVGGCGQLLEGRPVRLRRRTRAQLRCRTRPLPLPLPLPLPPGGVQRVRPDPRQRYVRPRPRQRRHPGLVTLVRNTHPLRRQTPLPTRPSLRIPHTPTLRLLPFILRRHPKSPRQPTLQIPRPLTRDGNPRHSRTSRRPTPPRLPPALSRSLVLLPPPRPRSPQRLPSDVGGPGYVDSVHGPTSGTGIKVRRTPTRAGRPSLRLTLPSHTQPAPGSNIPLRTPRTTRSPLTSTDLPHLFPPSAPSPRRQRLTQRSPSRIPGPRHLLASHCRRTPRTTLQHRPLPARAPGTHLFPNHPLAPHCRRTPRTTLQHRPLLNRPPGTHLFPTHPIRPLNSTHPLRHYRPHAQHLPTPVRPLAARPGAPRLPQRPPNRLRRAHRLPHHPSLRNDTRSDSSRSVSSVSAASPPPRIESASARLLSSISAIRSSTVPSVMSR
ncbi:hypothetical protein a10_00551 [Streptomyces acidiscabies]|nr:hypothetical protein a10_00551 [Streptomyces acidiscabies]